MQEERKMILKMIEDGKITAEEGLQLLNALKDPATAEKKEESKKVMERSLSRDVDWENSRRRGYTEHKGPSFATRFTEFIEDAIQKIKEFDLDFNFGSSVEIEHIFQHRDAKVRRADIHLENGSITFRPWEEQDVRIECNVKVYKVKDGDEARRTFLDEVVFDVTDDKLRFESRRKSFKVNTVIYLPKKDLEKIKLYTFNGRINGSEVVADKFEAQTVNGRISFDKIKGDDVRLETVNGTISVSKLDVENCDAQTVNGTIAISAVKGKLDAETLNGTINYTLLNSVDSRAYMKTTTGSVTVTVPSEVKTEGELKTTVGGIHCDLPKLTVIEEKKEFANKKMSFLANRDGEQAFYIEAEATTGSITVRN
ncbi:DUF4097 and DUF4098 domain-containing protein YvlB [Evansella vedderi]|uniref:DUF4097 and DUF4098 domain-containing protein YvlB n=1 Tax=Evansella vedderi TaxID=38282 RepID=A0ABT9ZTJ8_9BACI|nr:DUF4097 domain-containing protein [Evansella vedderi]MDQ0254567.1 DUF4097 and DUF4098 domain-containing protein YvlB [Evansella vedderi]